MMHTASWRLEDSQFLLIRCFLRPRSCNIRQQNWLLLPDQILEMLLLLQKSLLTLLVNSLDLGARFYRGSRLVCYKRLIKQTFHEGRNWLFDWRMFLLKLFRVATIFNDACFILETISFWLSLDFQSDDRRTSLGSEMLRKWLFQSIKLFNLASKSTNLRVSLLLEHLMLRLTVCQLTL